MKKLLLITTALVAFSVSAEESDTRNIWECNEHRSSDPILWLVKDGENSYIKFHDERIPALQYLLGLNNYWSWDSYTIKLEVTNIAFYFNKDDPIEENGDLTSQQAFYCKKIQKAATEMEGT